MSDYGFMVGKNGRLVCLGDSITQASDGYVSILQNMISAGYPERNIRVINAGIGGHKAPDLLARLERDVIAKQPTVVTVNVGINDVWHGFTWDAATQTTLGEGNGGNGVPIEAYTASLIQIVATLREATDAEVVLLPPTVIGEDVDSPDNKANLLLERYVAAMKRVADAENVPCATTHEDFVNAIRAGRSANPDFRLTTDGVHLNGVGNTVFALSVLATLGFAGLVDTANST